jgi:hypothetical protein
MIINVKELVEQKSAGEIKVFEKSTPMTLYSQCTLHDLTLDQTWAAMVGSL